MTPKEYRHRAEEFLKLANETKDIFAKTALLEMVAEFRGRLPEAGDQDGNRTPDRRLGHLRADRFLKRELRRR
jgi:hypothetical protein